MKVKESTEMIFSGGSTEERTRRCKMIKKMLLMALVIMLFGVGLSHADNPDCFTITIAPTGWRGVIIDTAAVNLDLGDIAVGTSTGTVAVPCITTGTIANIEYEIKASVSGGANLNTDGNILSSELGVTAEFAAGDPGLGSITDVVTDGFQHVNDTKFTSGGYMDSMGLGDTKNLWCKITLPIVISYSGPQNITVTLTAQDGSLE